MSNKLELSPNERHILHQCIQQYGDTKILPINAVGLEMIEKTLLLTSNSNKNVRFYWDIGKQKHNQQKHSDYPISTIIDTISGDIVENIQFGKCVDYKHSTRTDKIWCIDGIKRAEIRWNRFHITPSQTRDLHIMKTIYVIREHLYVKYPVIRIISGFAIPFWELPSNAKESYNKIIDKKAFYHSFLAFIHQYKALLDWISILANDKEDDSMKVYRDSSSSEIVDLSESNLQSLSVMELNRLVLVEPNDEDVRKIGQLMFDQYDMYHLEKYYSYEDDYNDPTGYFNRAYHEHYDDMEFTDTMIKRLKKFNHDNVNIFNECVDIVRKKNDGNLPLEDIEEVWPEYLELRKAIAYAAPQIEILEKMRKAFGSDIVDPIWQQTFSDHRYVSA